MHTSEAQLILHTKLLIFRSPSKKLTHTIATAPVIEDKGKVPPGRPPRPYDNKVQSLGAREPRQAWGEGNPSDELVTDKSPYIRYSKTIVTYLLHEADNRLKRSNFCRAAISQIGRNLYMKEVTIVLEQYNLDNVSLIKTNHITVRIILM